MTTTMTTPKGVEVEAARAAAEEKLKMAEEKKARAEEKLRNMVSQNTVKKYGEYGQNPTIF
jgi:hypothetical protein